MKTQDYLKTFFAEKKIAYQLFEIKDKHNNVHLIDTDVVVEHILHTSTSEQNQIANVIRRIDFKNGSITHFLKFLAHQLIKQYEIA